MFKDIGKTLCITGEILFWLFIATGGILFLRWAGEAMDYPYYIEYDLLFVALVPLVGAFTAALPLYGFGKLIQDVQAIRAAAKNQ